jgi:hypothetical protein
MTKYLSQSNYEYLKLLKTLFADNNEETINEFLNKYIKEPKNGKLQVLKMTLKVIMILVIIVK